MREAKAAPMHRLHFMQVWAMLMMLLTGNAWAQSSACGFIQNPDLQAQCRATTGGGSSTCGFIRDPDLQAHCRATIQGSSSECGFIRDPDRQAYCREIGRAHV